MQADRKNTCGELALFGFITAVISDLLFKGIASRAYDGGEMCMHIANLTDRELALHVGSEKQGSPEAFNAEQVRESISGSLTDIYALHCEMTVQYPSLAPVEFDCFHQTYRKEVSNYLKQTPTTSST